MIWLSAVLLGVGVLALLVLVLVTARVVRRTEAAARTFNVATTGRTRRVRAGLAEIGQWRRERRTGHDPDPST